MLVKLLPDQVAQRWDVIAEAIRNSRPGFDSNVDKMNNILARILSGDMICWVNLEQPDRPDTIIITAIVEEEAAEAKDLLIYALGVLERLPAKLYVKIAQKLAQFGKARGCENVVGYFCDDKYHLGLKEMGFSVLSFAIIPCVDIFHIGEEVENG